jgi:hypothetical protein
MPANRASRAAGDVVMASNGANVLHTSRWRALKSTNGSFDMDFPYAGVTDGLCAKTNNKKPRGISGA